MPEANERKRASGDMWANHREFSTLVLKCQELIGKMLLKCYDKNSTLKLDIFVTYWPKRRKLSRRRSEWRKAKSEERKAALLRLLGCRRLLIVGQRHQDAIV